MEGKPFTIKVNEGDQVTPTTELVEMDRRQVTDAGKKTTVITVITNSTEHVGKAKDLVQSGTAVKAGKKVFEAITK